MIGDVLAGRYRLTARIAQGGMADVYTGVDERLERTVAVKILRPDGRADPSAFLDELQAQGQLNHHAVVRLFDAGTHADRCYLVMEYVPGRSLKDTIADGVLPPRRAAGIGRCVAEALAAAHAADVVHRDVKPANVLLDPEGQVRLADFGIAGLAHPAAADHKGVTYGTAAYLSPEQVRGEPVGPPADVYALGLVLLEALTGRREYRGPPLEAAVARLSRDPGIPDLPEGWAAFLRAMTAQHPAGRPTADAAAARLRELSRGASGAAPAMPLVPTPTGSRPRRQALVAVGSALLLAAVLLTMALRPDGAPVEAEPQPPAVTEQPPPPVVEEPGGTAGD